VKQHDVRQFAIIDSVIASLARELAKENPRFNTDTFYSACYSIG